MALQPEGPWNQLWGRRNQAAIGEGTSAAQLGDRFAVLDRRDTGATVLRAPVELLNACSLTMEVRLQPSTAAPDASEVQEEVFENERLLPIRGWGPPPLSKFRGRFSDRDASVGFDEFPERELPPGWVWAGPWELDLGWLSKERRRAVEQAYEGWDKQGWFYATTFAGHTWPPGPAAEWQGVCTTRRRRWVRTRVRKDALGRGQGGPGGDRAARAVSWTPRTVGLVRPGATLSLPWGSLDRYPPYELQVRPVSVPEPPANSPADAGGDPAVAKQQDLAAEPVIDPLAQWSVPVIPAGAAGAASSSSAGATADSPPSVVALSRLGNNQSSECSELVCCFPEDPPDPSAGPPGARLVGSGACWVTVAASAKPVAGPAGAELADWRLTLAFPMVLHNLTPADAVFAVWEGDPETGQPKRKVHAGTIKGGEKASVYCLVRAPATLSRRGGAFRLALMLPRISLLRTRNPRPASAGPPPRRVVQLGVPSVRLVPLRGRVRPRVAHAPARAGVHLRREAPQLGAPAAGRRAVGDGARGEARAGGERRRAERGVQHGRARELPVRAGEPHAPARGVRAGGGERRGGAVAARRGRGPRRRRRRVGGGGGDGVDGGARARGRGEDGGGDGDGPGEAGAPQPAGREGGGGGDLRARRGQRHLHAHPPQRRLRHGRQRRPPGPEALPGAPPRRAACWFWKVSGPALKLTRARFGC